jgi:outer membrane protein OmpA-like peptidoglycan-associated protein
MGRRVAVAWALVLASAVGANAQSGSSGASTAQNQPGTTATSAPSQETRPATTTFFGDTGLWFVPTAEVLPRGKWSVSGYRRGTNYIQGFSNIGDFAGTFAIGVANHLEIFGSFLFDTRIDRDIRPIFVANDEAGGIIDRYPRVNRGWTGDNPGDFYVGAKVNFITQADNDPAALAVRALIKAPTGDDAAGVSTGKADVAFDLIGSAELNSVVELSGFVGYEVRGKPSGIDIPNGAFRWGAGAGFPSRSPLRGIVELNGFLPNEDVATITGARITAVDGSLSPIVSATENITRFNVGVTWQHTNGFFLGGGLAWNLPTRSRDGFSADSDPFGDYADWQVRLGYHPGARRYVPPPPPPPPAPMAPAPVPQNRPPTVQAQCDPCTVEVGRTSTVTANAQDPDGDALTYRWTSPQGTLANPAARQSLWTAPQQEGTVPVTVAVDDGKGGTASASVNINVTRPPVKNYTFEDVHFDFDRYNLRPEATRVLDEAVTAMQQDATLRIQIEGHTCNIGTAEYNLALGDRRATSVRDYLISRGIAAGRLSTVTYGEERPRHDNSREETRRLNRRAALVVNLQK